MKGAVFILLVIGIVFFLRINLPPNNINDNVHIKSDGLLNRTIAAVLLTDTVADWQYIDFIVFKYACSENLKIRLVAFPFGKWEKSDENIKSCNTKEIFQDSYS